MVYLEWMLSIQAAIMLWMMGNADYRGPIVGLFGQILWIVFALYTKHYGLLPGILMFTIVHARNFMKMKKNK
jgi:hypothetical protein